MEGFSSALASTLPKGKYDEFFERIAATLEFVKRKDVSNVLLAKTWRNFVSAREQLEEASKEWSDLLEIWTEDREASRNLETTRALTKALDDVVAECASRCGETTEEGMRRLCEDLDVVAKKDESTADSSSSTTSDLPTYGGFLKIIAETLTFVKSGNASRRYLAITWSNFVSKRAGVDEVANACLETLKFKPGDRDAWQEFQDISELGKMLDDVVAECASRCGETTEEGMQRIYDEEHNGVSSSE